MTTKEWKRVKAGSVLRTIEDDNNSYTVVVLKKTSYQVKDLYWDNQADAYGEISFECDTFKRDRFSWYRVNHKLIKE